VPFKKILRELVESTPAANGAILADWEGEAVEQHCLYDDYEIKFLGAHKGIVLNRMKEAQDECAGGELRDAVITTSKQHVIIGVVGPEYSLVMTLAREALIGLALFRFRQAVRLLEKEIY
jgi:predicted regulator of Ras-like GTPase activity (Roadblock/LC7/MglB family)